MKNGRKIEENVWKNENEIKREREKKILKISNIQKVWSNHVDDLFR